MARPVDQQDDAFASGIRARRKNLLVRLVIAALAPLVFTPVIGFGPAMLWMGAYYLSQLIDLWAFGPINAGQTQALPAWRKAVGGFGLALGTLVYGLLTLPMWQTGGVAGGVCAVLVLAGGTMNALMSSGRSRLVLALTMTPLSLYLAMTPLLLVMNGASGPSAMAAMLACLAFFGFVVGAFTTTSQLAEAEARARAELARRSAEAEAATAGKSAFIATVSHDLRTPLSAILTGAAELEARATDSRSRAEAALISDAGRMMKALLDDLLDHAKLGAGRMQVEPRAFGLRSLLAHVLMFWQVEARKRGLKLRIRGASQVPAWVHGDPVRIQQILNNLISNAVKFTPAGEICLSVRSWPEDDGRWALVMDVADTGKGMDADQLTRLFTAYEQTAIGVAQAHGGTGLGLWISRELTRLMGGHLTARSRPGAGSVFTLALTLPEAEPVEGEVAPTRPAPLPAPAKALAPQAEAQPLPPLVPAPEPEPLEVAAETEAAAPEEADRPLRILVVDDHDINRRAIQLILAPLGAELAEAANGMAALDQAGQQAFDVIFMDVRMPELDGRETTRRIRATAGPNQATPIIAVTADSSPEDVAACHAAGMTWFVAKPLTPVVLLSALEAVLGQGQTLDEVVAGSAAA